MKPTDPIAAMNARKAQRPVRKKRPDAAGNARPKVKYVTHAAHAALLTDPLDGRTRVGRAYRAHVEALRAHLGGDPTLPEEELIDQAARLNVLAGIAWGELMHTGVFAEGGGTSPALNAFLKTLRDQRQVLELLGLRRRTRDVTLKDVVEGNVDRPD